MSNIHGLSSKRAEKKADEEEYSQGAAGQSGTAVWRPTASAARGPNGGPADPFADILAQAKANSGSAPSGASDRNLGMITLYQNGFIIGNGEFRDIKDPKNKGVLDQLKRGEVPDELEAICRKEWGENKDAVSVNLVDKTQEMFTPPPPKFSFATSQGQSLGGSSSSSAAATAASFADATPRQLTVDAAQPTTALQIVLADRKRVKVTANQTATVLDVYQHVMSLTGLSGFELVAGFPPKPLASPGVTLKDAGLLNGSITQRGGA